MSKARDLANAGTALTNVSPTELGYLDGVTSAVQTQIDAKSGTSHNHSGTYEPTLPSQTGNSGKYLTTDGTSKSWGTVSQYALPSQTGNSGKYLTTDGTSESWGAVSSGGMTLLATTSVGTGTSVTISGISQSYKQLYFVWKDLKFSGADTLTVRINGNSASNSHNYMYIQAGTTTVVQGNTTYIPVGYNTNANYISNGTLTIPNYTDTTLNAKIASFNFSSIYIGSSNGLLSTGIGQSNGNSAASYVGTGAVTSVWFGLQNWNFSSGTILTYGVN